MSIFNYNYCYRYPTSCLKIWRYLSGRNISVNADQEQNTTHFGFETVERSEKPAKVYKVFEDVAQSYDLMNDAMSVGIHRLWKDIFIHRLGPRHGLKLLDMAGGTGDIAFRHLKQLNHLSKQLKADVDVTSIVTIGDINKNMLEVGQSRYNKFKEDINANNNISVNWVEADAENLPFDNNSFSAYTIAFGIRNCTNMDKVLKEAYRVLEPGGCFMCLEFSHLPNSTLQWLYDKYSFNIIPPMGYLLAGQWHHYQYLVGSIRRFPNQLEFKEMIEDAGFLGVNYENLTFGICAIHSGFKII